MDAPRDLRNVINFRVFLTKIKVFNDGNENDCTEKMFLGIQNRQEYTPCLLQICIS